MNTLSAFLVGIGVGAAILMLVAVLAERAEEVHRATGDRQRRRAEPVDVATLKATIAQLHKAARLLAHEHAERTEYSGTRSMAESQSDHDWTADEWLEWACREARAQR